MIRTLVVDDSAIVRAMLSHVIKDDGRLEMVGQAENGLKAVNMNDELKPDLIIMDYNMPVLDGLAAARQIYTNSDHLPAIVTFTTEDDESVREKFICAGVLAVEKKPNIASMTSEELKKFCDRLVENYNKRSAKVIPSARYFSQVTGLSSESEEVEKPAKPDNAFLYENHLDIWSIPDNYDYSILIVGASTGGPEALKTLITDLGPDFPLPVLITQHIDSLFDKQLASWLSTVTKVPVELARDNIHPQKGHVYLAPSDHHLEISTSFENSQSFVMHLSTKPRVHFLRPAVDEMFKSVRKFYSNRIIAVMLTGMGSDGSEELLKLHQEGAYCICQDESTSVVFGMPKAAIDLGAANKILPLDKIGPYVWSLLK